MGVVVAGRNIQVRGSRYLFVRDLFKGHLEYFRRRIDDLLHIDGPLYVSGQPDFTSRRAKD